MTRSKSLPIKSPRNSLDPYPSPAPLPEEEANQRAGGSGVSNKRYGPQSDTDVEVVTDTFEGRNMQRKKRHCLGTSETDREGSQPLELEACIVCDISDELVSRCSGSECLLWFHGECLDAEFGSSGGEDDANLYCPYCWFKILAMRSIRLKEKAVEAEMAVFKYLDKEMGSKGVLNGQEDAVDTTDIVSDQELEGEKTAYSSKVEQVKLCEKDFDESRGENMELVEENNQSKADKEKHTDKPEDKVVMRSIAMRSIRLKEKAAEAEMVVFKYLDKEMGSRGEVEESVLKGQEDAMDTTDIVSGQELEAEKGAYSSKEEQVKLGEKDFDESRGENMELVEENVQSEADKEKHNDKPEDKVVDEVEDSNDEERAAAATENFQDAEDYKTAEDKTKANTGGEKWGDASLFLSMQESFSGKEHDLVQQNEKRRRKRRLILNAFDSDVSSNGSTNEPNGEDAAEKVTSMALEVTSPSGKMKNQQREHSRTTNVDNSKTARDISIFQNQKRRLLWTPEEEYMLKVGVEKFAAESKRNMPWRKILEMGQKVFHETRAPADLKDKWRNMMGARLGKKNKQDSTQISGM